MPTAPRRQSLERILAARIRELAALRGIPLIHIADRAVIARSHLFELLRARRSATLGMPASIAEVLGVTPTALLTETPGGAEARSKRPPRRASSRKR